MLPTGARSETWRAPRCGAQRHGASSKPATRVRGASSKPATRVRGASSKPATRVRGVRDSRTWPNLRLAHVQTAYFREIKRLAHVAGAMKKQRLAHVDSPKSSDQKLHAECLGQTKSYHAKQINLLGSYLAASFRGYGERKKKQFKRLYAFTVRMKCVYRTYKVRTQRAHPAEKRQGATPLGYRPRR